MFRNETFRNTARGPLNGRTRLRGNSLSNLMGRVEFTDLEQRAKSRNVHRTDKGIPGRTGYRNGMLKRDIPQGPLGVGRR